MLKKYEKVVKFASLIGAFGASRSNSCIGYVSTLGFGKEAVGFAKSGLETLVWTKNEVQNQRQMLKKYEKVVKFASLSAHLAHPVSIRA